MYNFETLDMRLMKSWVAAYKILDEVITDETSKSGWMWEANKLRHALFISLDKDTQEVLDKLWDSVVV